MNEIKTENEKEEELLVKKMGVGCSNAKFDKLIIISGREIINLKSVSHIHVVMSEIAPLMRKILITMNNGYEFEILCNDIEDANQILFDITHCLLYETDKDIIEISRYLLD